MLSWYTWGVFGTTLYCFARVHYYNGVLRSK